MTEPIEANVEVANTVILWRIYDVLMLILKSMDEELADKLVQSHEQGIFATPPPAYRVEGEDDEGDERAIF